MSKIIAFSPCKICGKPIASDEVARAGYEAEDHRSHPMLAHLPARGEYCDHFKEINAIK